MKSNGKPVYRVCTPITRDSGGKVETFWPRVLFHRSQRSQGRLTTMTLGGPTRTARTTPLARAGSTGRSYSSGRF